MFAKKSLGQNFLISETPVRKMVEMSEVGAKDIVLEIGPGKGILTEALLKTGATVIAVEKDDMLSELLRMKFFKEISEKKLLLVHADILDCVNDNFFSNYKLTDKSFKLIANIPYNITGEIMRTFLEGKFKPSLMCFLVQKEVAERVIAKDKKESLLSISVKVFGVPQFLGTVKNTMFRPIPKVDSAILLIKNISNNFFKDIDQQKFFEILHAGFAHKRKQLGGNLKGLVSIENLEKSIGSGKRRAEELSKEEWKKITSS